MAEVITVDPFPVKYAIGDSLWLFHNLYEKYKLLRVPTNASWAVNNLNGTVGQEPMRLFANTSVTASSRGLAYTNTVGLNSGDISYYYIDWTKRLELSFILIRQDSDTEEVGRFQLKETLAEGVLAAKGIGIQVSNFTVVGEAFGTARQTTGTLKTLTDRLLIRVKIVLTSASVEFWVDGVKVETLTGTAVPSTASVTYDYLVLSNINGVTGGVNTAILVSDIQVLQAW